MDQHFCGVYIIILCQSTACKGIAIISLNHNFMHVFYIEGRSNSIVHVEC